MTPKDGFWIRLRAADRGASARVAKGYSDAYIGYQNKAVPLLPVGKQWNLE